MDMKQKPMNMHGVDEVEYAKWKSLQNLISFLRRLGLSAKLVERKQSMPEMFRDIKFMLLFQRELLRSVPPESESNDEN